MSVRDWIFTRDSPATEATLVVGGYAAYQGARGLTGGSTAAAFSNAERVRRLEVNVHLFAAPGIQHRAADVPGLLSMLGVSYVTLHLTVTAAVLVWLYMRRPALFSSVRVELMAASTIGLIGFTLLPTAPPRLALANLDDVVSRTSLNLNHGFVHALYNPFAAMPSMHIAYATIIGVALVRHGGRRRLRAAGVLYPPFVVFVTVATGNHFLLDAAAGAVVAGISTGTASWLRPASTAAIALDKHGEARRGVALREAA